MKDDGVLSVLYNTQGIALAGPSGLVSPGFSYSLCVTRHDLQSFPVYNISIGIRLSYRYRNIDSFIDTEYYPYCRQELLRVDVYKYN